MKKKEIKSRIAFIMSDSELLKDKISADAVIDLKPQYCDSIKFDEHNIRQITKFLASTDINHPLIVRLNSNPVLNDKYPEYDVIGISARKLDLRDVTFSVQFNGHMNYSFFVGDNHYFDFKNGVYEVPKDNTKELYKALKDWKVNDDDIVTFKEYLKILIDAGHGTTLVFCKCPTFYKKESDRLIKAKRGIKIAPIELFKLQDGVETFLKQTAVADGGFFINIDGNCEVINVIFDGEVSVDWGDEFVGRADRGSRYNSLNTYVFGKNYRCIHSNTCENKDCCMYENSRVFAIIISDDGMVNVIS